LVDGELSFESGPLVLVAPVLVEEPAALEVLPPELVAKLSIDSISSPPELFDLTISLDSSLDRGVDEGVGAQVHPSLRHGGDTQLI